MTYGSLGAAGGMMMWMWISMVVILVGAQLNAEIEHQTARDSTVERDKPLGRRGAVKADTSCGPPLLVSRPMAFGVVVLNAWVTETKDTVVGAPEDNRACALPGSLHMSAKLRHRTDGVRQRFNCSSL